MTTLAIQFYVDALRSGLRKAWAFERAMRLSGLGS